VACCLSVPVLSPVKVWRAGSLTACRAWRAMKRARFSVLLERACLVPLLGVACWVVTACRAWRAMKRARFGVLLERACLVPFLGVACWICRQRAVRGVL
jgi:hypothetical protein